MKQETIKLAEKFGAKHPSDLSYTKIMGKRREGLQFLCKVHGPLCTVHLTDDVAYHLDDHEDVVESESTEYFAYRSRPYFQDWQNLGHIYTLALASMMQRWVWTDMLKEGTITILAGPPKLGKSTLVFDFLGAMARREPEFLGEPITPSNVLYCTEEGLVPLGLKAAVARWIPIRDAQYITFLRAECVPYADSDEPQWLQLLRRIDEAVKELHETPDFLPEGYPLLVVIDTLGFFMNVDDENDAAQVRNQLKALVLQVRQQGFACLLVHHAKKGRASADSNWIDQIRGSTAFAGNVDTLAVLDGYHTRPDRKLYRLGRLFDLMDPLDLKFDKDGGYRLPTPEEKEVEGNERRKAVVRVLAADIKATTRKIETETGRFVSKSRAAEIKKHLVAESEVHGVSFKEYIIMLNADIPAGVKTLSGMFNLTGHDQGEAA